MKEQATDPLREFRHVNALGTERLAEEAVKAGIKRLVFISSIKVNGEETAVPYKETDKVATNDPYGISKLEAEMALRRIEKENRLEVTVLRPTLVYGPGVKANFLNLMKIVQRGVPLPLASVNNLRSMVYVGNLADALAVCASHANAAGQTYMVSDGEEVSTPELIRRMAAALGRPARLVPFPPLLMRSLGKLTGKTAEMNRLLGSLTVDCGKIRRELGWNPPYTMEEGLMETAKWYKNVIADNHL